jgi:hypothetical protein
LGVTTVPAKEQRCLYCRDSEGVGLGRGVGHCDLDGDQTDCHGDLGHCEKPCDLRKYQIEQSESKKDRRQYPRFLLDLPLEYLVTNAPKAHGGLVVNVSEVGLLIRSVKNMSIGTELKVAVLFPQEYELASFEVLAKIIRKDLVWEEDWEGYEYGLEIIRILEVDKRKLRQVLSGQFSLEKIS